MYCDGQIYRFTGEVVWSGDTNFLLKITDAQENNLISCYNTSENVWVSKGNIVCVYGTGIGEDTYTRTYSNGMVQEYTTLAVDVGFVLYQEEHAYDFTENLEMNPAVKEFMYGTYELTDSSSTPYLIESTFSIDEYGINGRPFTVDSIYIDFAGTSITGALDSKVYVELNVISPSKHMDEQNPVLEYPMTFQFALDGSGCNYGSSWFDKGAYFQCFDTASYVKTN